MNDGERLFDTVEKLRAADYSELDAKLVREVLTNQVRFQDDRVEAQRRTNQMITRWASEHAGTGGGADG